MRFKGVLFDKDGTLIEVNDTWVPIYRQFLMDQFRTDAAGADALMAKAGYDIEAGKFRANSILASGTTRQLIRVWWPGLDAAGIEAKVRVLDHDYAPLARAVLTPLFDLEPVFAELKAMGLELGVGTNDNHLSATNHMAHIGVIDHFAEIIAADTVEVPKPSGNMVRKFAEVTGLQTFDIVMVGDNAHDMDEARNGGAGLAVAVLSGNAAAGDIAHLADHVIPSVADLPALLRSL